MNTLYNVRYVRLEGDKSFTATIGFTTLDVAIEHYYLWQSYGYDVELTASFSADEFSEAVAVYKLDIEKVK